MANQHNFSLLIPSLIYETEYIRVIDLWESYNEKIQPPSMRRYSEKDNFLYSKWLADIEDDRVTGSMLENNIPCTLYFFVNESNEILGGVSINHANTFRGQLHVGIVPWHRGKGYGATMLNLALSRCRDMGLDKIQMTTRKDNHGASKIIIRNGGVLLEEFFDNKVACLRYEIKL